MSSIILVKNGEKYTRTQWAELISSGEADVLLKKYGPALTEEAWARHHGKVGKR